MPASSCPSTPTLLPDAFSYKAALLKSHPSRKTFHSSLPHVQAWLLKNLVHGNSNWTTSHECLPLSFPSCIISSMLLRSPSQWIVTSSIKPILILAFSYDQMNITSPLFHNIFCVPYLKLSLSGY